MSVLSKEQEHAHTILIKDCNLLISGISGTGKSHLLLSYLSGKGRSRATAVTAVTLASAANLLGSTINGYFGLGNISESTTFNYLIDQVRTRQYGIQNIVEAKELIIDQVERLHVHVFDLLDELFRTIKENNKPFGGVRVILVGDFCQMPPVSSFLDWKLNKLSSADTLTKISNSFCFNSKVWGELKFESLLLQQYQRPGNMGPLIKDASEGPISADNKRHLESRITDLSGFFNKFFTKENATSDNGKMIICAHTDRVNKLNALVERRYEPKHKRVETYKAKTVPAVPLGSYWDTEDQFNLLDEVILGKYTRVRLLKTATLTTSKITNWQGENHSTEMIVVRSGSLGTVVSFANLDAVTKKKHIGLLDKFPPREVANEPNGDESEVSKKSSKEPYAVEVLLDSGHYIFVGIVRQNVQVDDVEYERSQIALEEAHASTAHTVQGSRCKQIIVAFSSENKLFRGQFVTAISRVESVENMFIDSDLALDRIEFGPYDVVKEFYSKMFPTVRFAWNPHEPGLKRSFDQVE